MRNLKQCLLCGSENISEVLKTEKFRIMACNACDVGFTYPAPKLPDYENMDFHSKEEANNVSNLVDIKDLPYDWQQLIYKKIDLIKANFSSDAQILEIGCGEGLLLNELKKSGFKNIEGFEPSRTAAVRAEKRGLKITNDYFSSQKTHQQYDLIIMAHVFEHIEKPHEFIEDLIKSLKPSGSILLVQTNYRGLIPRVLKQRWYAWVPDQHFWHFTIKSLKHILSSKNMSLQHYTYTPLVHSHHMLYKVANIKNSFKDQFFVLFKRNENDHS